MSWEDDKPVACYDIRFGHTEDWCYHPRNFTHVLTDRLTCLHCRKNSLCPHDISSEKKVI